jgi:serine/threonine protein kinase
MHDEPLARAEALVGQEVGAGLELAQLIAVGDLMSVFVAKSPRRGALAVKLLHPDLAPTIAGDMPSVLRIANDLAHPHAPTVAEEIAVGDTLGVVTQLVGGESLQALLARRRALPPAEALRIAGDVLAVLDVAHSRGFVHGALTPSHVLLTAGGEVRVIGFGERRLRRPIERDVWAGWLAPESRDRTAIDAPVADLWAVAALTFAMMTGRCPYGPSIFRRDAVEAAAALALDKVAPRAPADLCRVLGRALARAPSQRWSDAGSLRAALLGVATRSDVVLATSLTSQIPPATVTPPVLEAVREMRRSSAPPGPPPVTPPRRQPTPPRREPTPPRRQPTPPRREPTAPRPRSVPPARPPSDAQPIELGVTSDERGSQALSTLFTALDAAIASRMGAGGDTTATFENLCATAIKTSLPGRLGCRIRNGELLTGMRSVWSRPGALTDAVYTLQRAGIEAIGILPGVAPEELERWVEVGAHAATPGANPAEVLERIFFADFAHVVFHASDPFAGMPENLRGSLDEERRRLLALFSFDSSLQLEDAWASARDRVSRPSQPYPDLMHEVAPLEARPSDPALAGIFALNDESDGERLMHLAATAMDGDAFEPALEAFGPVLRHRLDRVAAHSAERASSFAVRLTSSVRAPSDVLLDRQRMLTAAVVSPAVSEALFRGLAASRPKSALLERLGELLPMLGAEHAVPLARALPLVSDADFASKIERHLELGIHGHEPSLGELGRSEAPPVAMRIVRILARIGTTEARRALDRIAESPHPSVRVEALGASDGAAGDRLRRELKRLLEEAPEAQRMANLSALIDRDVRVAAPAIALRLRAPDLDTLSYEERRLLFNGVCLLAPSRAETVAREILANKKLLSSPPHEETRALAAATLGAVGASEESVAMLEELARRRWGTSEPVREAAERALLDIAARREVKR